MDINHIYVINLTVINTVHISLINRITEIAFMRYVDLYLKDICYNITSKN